MNSAPDSLLSAKQGFRVSGKWEALFPYAISVITVGLAVLVIATHQAYDAKLMQSLEAENRLHLETIRANVEDVFEEAYSTLMFMSRDPNVLSPNYVVPAGNGWQFSRETRSPAICDVDILRYEGEGGARKVAGADLLMEPDSSGAIFSETGDEMQTAILEKQLSQFEAEPERAGTMSPVINRKCAKSNTGFDLDWLLSVPVRVDGRLAGLLGGFMPSKFVSEIMERGNFHAMVLLIDSSGNIVGCKDLPDSTISWYKAQFSRAGAEGFFADASQVIEHGAWAGDWSPLKMPTHDKYWLIYEYDKDFHLSRGHYGTLSSTWWSVATIFGLGLILALYVRMLRRRQSEQIRFLKERQAQEEQLEKSVSLLNATLESTTDGILVVSKEGQIVSCNRKFVSMWNISEELLESKDDERVIASILSQLKDPDGFVSQVQKLYASPTKESFDLLEFNDGRVFERYSLPQTVAGAHAGRVWSFRDVTTRHHAELTLKRNEERYRTLVLHQSEGVGLVDINERFTFANPAADAIFGVSRGSLVGRNLREFTSDEQWEVIREQTGHRSRGEEGSYEFEITLPDGRRRTLRVTTVIWPGTEGADLLTLGLFHDITESRRAEIALRQSEERYRMLADYATDMISTHFPDGTCTYISPSCGVMTGYDPDEVTGKSTLDFIHADDIETAQVLFAAKGGHSEQAAEFRIRRKDGTYIWVETRASAVRNPETGQISHVVASTRDVSERHTAVLAVRESEQKFRVLAEELPNMIFINVKGRIVYANKAWEHVMGYTREQLLAPDFNFLCFFARESQGSIMEVYRAHLRGEPFPAREYSLVTRHGDVVYAIVATQIINYAGSAAILAVVTDVTERRQVEKALQQSEHQYRSLIERMTDIVYTVSLDLRCMSISPAFETATGWSSSDWIGKEVTELIHPDDLLKARSTHEACMRDEQMTSYEVRIKTRSGDYLRLEVKSSVLLREGTCVGTMGVARDITERMHAQEQIRKLSKAIEQSPASVVITDINGRIEYVNPKFTLLTGYTFEEALGKNPSILKSGLTPPEVYTELWQTITAGREWHGHLQNRRKDGSLYWEHASISGLINDSGIITHFIAVKEDITERVGREKELRKLSAAIMQSANLVVITDPEGIIEYVNPKFCSLTGFAPEELAGITYQTLAADGPGQVDSGEIWRLVRSGQTWTGNVLSRKRSGESFWERRTIAPVLDDLGRVTNFVSVSEDITNEIESQQKLAEADKLAAIGVLAAGVAHEFKNYLGGIIGNASFALEELDGNNPDQRIAHETLIQIVQMGERANEVAMSLLTYSKAKPEEMVRTSLQTIVTNTINLVQKEMKGRSIEIITYMEEAPEIQVSPSKIQQLLLNLLINAEHAISEAGIITIALTQVEHCVRLSVGDTGNGIPPRNLQRIFDPFFSTKGVWGKDKLAGTGMGLAICRNIAREHNGDLTVESIVGVGTTFTVTLPVDEVEITHALAAAHDLSMKRMLVFSLNTSILGHYFKQACADAVELRTFDDISKVEADIRSAADMVICDAQFSGKVELYRMVEACRNQHIPYVMVNCGPLEYQLSHLYDQAAANFRGLPEFSAILSVITTTPDKAGTT